MKLTIPMLSDPPDDQPTDSVLVLIAANLIPLFGVIFWDWDVFYILLLFWLENGVIGVYNVFRMALAQSDLKKLPAEALEKLPILPILQKFFMICFFLMHYFGFMFGHGVFLFAFTGMFEGDRNFDIWNLVLTVLVGVAGLFVSHGYSFFRNYVKGKEYERVTVQQQMNKPYSRIIIMHITIVVGAAIALQFKDSAFLVAVLVVLKIGVDVYFHLRERRKYRTNKPVTHRVQETSDV